VFAVPAIVASHGLGTPISVTGSFSISPGAFALNDIPTISSPSGPVNPLSDNLVSALEMELNKPQYIRESFDPSPELIG
jgi:hypothetical protein